MPTYINEKEKLTFYLAFVTLFVIGLGGDDVKFKVLIRCNQVATGNPANI